MKNCISPIPVKNDLHIVVSPKFSRFHFPVLIEYLAPAWWDAEMPACVFPLECQSNETGSE